MCKCDLLLFVLICLSLTEIGCDVAVPEPHDASLDQKEPIRSQVTQDFDTGQAKGSETRHFQKRLLWTNKQSLRIVDIPILDSPDMKNWIFSGLPSYKYHILTSPKNCCAGYNKTIKGAKNTHIRLVFLDVYLLPGSVIDILHATTENDKSKIIKTIAQNHRLIAESKGNVLCIKIDEISSLKNLEWHKLPSFTAVYWEVPDSIGIWQRRPYTQCPITVGAMTGGEVKLPAFGIISHANYVYDCIWMIRIPIIGWDVYIRITEMDLPGFIEIRHGLNSSSPLLATNRQGTTIDSLHQPVIGFWGKENGGLYVRVVKPVNEGHLYFVYGTSKFPVKDECDFYFKDKSVMQGWNCNEPSMCIPLNHTCNGVRNCPNGQDEDFYICHTCKGAHEKQCWSGECVLQIHEFCPEEPCPIGRPFRCDKFHKCYAQVERCNGIQYCDDGEDEQGCLNNTKKAPSHGQVKDFEIQQVQERVLWTKKRSVSSATISALDSPDMQSWVYSGQPRYDYHILISPRNCCAGYNKTIKGARNTHIRLVFLDVYLLPGSEMRILEASTEKDAIRIDQMPPPYPRLIAESKANVLHIIIDEIGSAKDLEWQELPTFTAVYWEVPDSLGVWRRRPYTQCPVAHAAMYGGEVVLPASGPVSAVDYIYDCIWMIRIPTTGWGVYIRVSGMDLHGHVEVRHGLNSSSPLLAKSGNGTTVDSLNQPDVGFWGRENGGLYVRVIKPINEGHFSFVYGISKLPENNECKFFYRGYFLMQGWNCKEPSMCIPLNHTCNEVNNCPFGQDEDHATCQPCKHAYEKQCWSGECVHRLLEFCPEDQCPIDRPFRCDWFHKCYSQIDKCNGIHYCDDGKDERGCPKTSKGLSTKTIVIIVCVSGLFTILPSIILCCWDDPVERDLQRAQEAFTNLCDLYSGRTLLTQIQAARRAGTLGIDQENRNTNHRPAYPPGANHEEVILLAPPDPIENQATQLATNSLIVPATETTSPRRPPRNLPNLTPPASVGNDSSSTSPTQGSMGSRGSQGSSRESRNSNAAVPPNSPPEATATLSPPPYLLQPDIAALEHRLPEEDPGHHHPPPYLSPPGGATADGLPPDTEAPPPYESVQHMSQPQSQQGSAETPPAYSH